MTAATGQSGLPSPSLRSSQLLRLACLLCGVALATARVAVTRLVEVSANNGAGAGASEPLHASVLRYGAAAFGVALIMQLILHPAALQVVILGIHGTPPPMSVHYTPHICN